MRAAPLPANESERLQALASYDILHSLPEASFDRLTRLAADLLGARLAIINFVDAARQWGKSCVGTDSTEAPREQSFCAWTILGSEPLIVPDALHDPRFAHNPLVRADPPIRAYLGAPLITPDGYALGAFCVTWTEPHEPDPREVRIVQELAAITVSELELRRRTLETEHQARANQELVQQLERANQELDAFTRTVSHDLRAPARHVQAFADLLLQAVRAEDAAKTARYATIIQSAAQRMDQLIQDLLAFARFADQPIHMQTVDLSALVHEIRTEVEEDTADRHIEWHVRELPTVQGDRALLRQVFLNLLSNAVKFTGRQERAVIEVHAERDGPYDIIHVTDNGAGFDPRYATKLFGVFQRLHRDEDFQGTGVGLATVQRIVQRHGGHVRAHGEVGRGAVFSVVLPRVKTAAEESHA